VDYSLPTAIKARQRSAEVGLWVTADVQSLPVRAQSVDGVVCFGVTQALEGPSRVARELWRVIRPGGYIWVDGLNKWCLPHVVEGMYRRFRGRGIHLRYESPWRLAKIFRENGFTEVKIHWLPIVPARWIWAQSLLESKISEFLLRFLPPFGASLSHAFIISARKG